MFYQTALPRKMTKTSCFYMNPAQPRACGLRESLSIRMGQNSSPECILRGQWRRKAEYA